MLTRPGETGRTTINGTRVGDGDFYEELLEDKDLEPMLHVLKFRAIEFNHITGEEEALWPEMYSLEKLYRMKAKVGQEAWDRNYMQQPGATNKLRTFSEAGIKKSLNERRRLNSFDGLPTDAGRTVYMSLDPGLDNGYNVVQAWLVSNDKMRLIWHDEYQHLDRNEDIVSRVRAVCTPLRAAGYSISDLVVESMNFQRGLARDERLKELKEEFGFSLREHLTNVNKYDHNIGIASMAGSFEAGNIELPYDTDDPLTKREIEEFIRQLRAWKPYVKGNKLRQDRPMAMWFAWILWQQRRKVLKQETKSWQRQGVPWKGTKTGLIIPIGVAV